MEYLEFLESKGTLKENDAVFCMNCDHEAHKDSFIYDSGKNCYYCPNCGSEILNF